MTFRLFTITAFQVKRNKELLAVDVKSVHNKNSGKAVNGVNNGNGRTPPSQGIIAALKDGFGFIETITHDREVFFRFRCMSSSSSLLSIVIGQPALSFFYILQVPVLRLVHHTGLPPMINS